MQIDKEKYIKIRGAQAQGARTVEDIKNMTGIAIENDDEYKEIEDLVKNVCRCKNVSVETVIDAVKNGAKTVEEVMEKTNAGTVCGRCKGIIANIVENKE